MTIAIDCRMIDASGIGVYLRGILPYLLESYHRFFLIGNPEKLNSFASKNVQIIRYTAGTFSVKELFGFFQRAIREINKADVFFTPFFNVPGGIKIPVYTVIHDIVFFDIPEITSRAGLAIRMWFYRRAYKISKKIFTVSEFSKSRIEYHLGTVKKIIVTHSAIRPQFLEYRNTVCGRRKAETIVYIGNIKKHKGLNYLLDAFLLAKKEGLKHKLIIIGDRDNFRTADDEILKKIDSLHGDTVSFTGFISDEQLMAHLASASLLVQPSLYEGFGLPPLEAMTLGTHALVSDIPVFKEIYRDYPVVFFRAGDILDLKDKLLELLSEQKPERITLSNELLSRYTFEKTASIILHELETQAD